MIPTNDFISVTNCKKQKAQNKVEIDYFRPDLHEN